jgi:hypothetical protein
MRFGFLVLACAGLVGFASQAEAGKCHSSSCDTSYVVYTYSSSAPSSCGTGGCPAVSSPGTDCAKEPVTTARKQVRVSFFDCVNNTWAESDAMVAKDDAEVGVQVEVCVGGKPFRAWVISVYTGPKGAPVAGHAPPTAMNSLNSGTAG